MLIYIFDKDRKLANVESTNEYKPCNRLYIPNPVRLLLKECKGDREIKIGYDVNKKENKAFFVDFCECLADETTGSTDFNDGKGFICNICGKSEKVVF